MEADGAPLVGTVPKVNFDAENAVFSRVHSRDNLPSRIPTPYAIHFHKYFREVDNI